MSLKRSYTLWAPIYDWVVDAPFRARRLRSLQHLPATPPAPVLIVGVGTGLDFPFLPPGHDYTGIDLTPAMLHRAEIRASRLGLKVRLEEGDARHLRFDDASFSHVILHLILAVTPHPEQVLAEACRVCQPGGQILILDKFLRPGQWAPLRRALNPLTRRIATRLDVVFEPMLNRLPALSLHADEAVGLGGWFRCIRLHKS